LFFLDLNIIFNLSHPSNHSQTSTNFTLNQITYTFNVEGERVGKEERNSPIFQSFMLCNGLRVTLRLQLCPKLFFNIIMKMI